MKKLMIALALVVGGLLAFNYVTTGELTVIPSFAKSDEQRAVQELADRFAAARKRLVQAERSAGVAGIDTSADAGAARDEATRILRDLKTLQKKLVEGKAKRQAEELAREVARLAES